MHPKEPLDPFHTDMVVESMLEINLSVAITRNRGGNFGVPGPD